MHNPHETGEPLIAQIGVVVICQLIRFQLPFVHHSPATIQTFKLSKNCCMVAWLIFQLKTNRDFYHCLQRRGVGISEWEEENYMDDREQM